MGMPHSPRRIAAPQRRAPSSSIAAAHGARRLTLPELMGRCLAEQPERWLYRNYWSARYQIGSYSGRRGANAVNSKATQGFCGFKLVRTADTIILRYSSVAACCRSSRELQMGFLDEKTHQRIPSAVLIPMSSPDVKPKEFTADALRSSSRFPPSPRLPACRGRMLSRATVCAASGTPSRVFRVGRSIVKRGPAQETGHSPPSSLQKDSAHLSLAGGWHG